MSEESKAPTEFVGQSDVQGRMRLLRYGLIAAVIIIFLVTWLVPYIFLSSYTSGLIEAAETAAADNPDLVVPEPVSVTTTLVWGIVAAVVTAVLGVIVYLVYGRVLESTMSGG